MAKGRAIRQKENNNLPTRYYSCRQETAVAKSVGGKQVVNSGATLFQKGDVSSNDYLFECKTKTSDSESISIKKEWLEKLSKEALFMGKPREALVISFGPSSDNYYIIPEWLFKELNGIV